MFPNLDERPSDSPFVERVWRSHNEREASFTSISAPRWSLVVSRLDRRLSVSVHGPETGATRQEVPPGLEWFGIDFKLGAFLPTLPPGPLANGCVVLLANERSFGLGDTSWSFPSFENADTFVDRLVRRGLLAFDSEVDAIARGEDPRLSPRAVQYRFLRATGLSHRTIRQIERARYAASLLKRGESILDTVFEAGYADQPHLTRSLRHFLGLTPTEVVSRPLVGLNPSL